MGSKTSCSQLSMQSTYIMLGKRHSKVIFEVTCLFFLRLRVAGLASGTELTKSRYKDESQRDEGNSEEDYKLVIACVTFEDETSECLDQKL